MRILVLMAVAGCGFHPTSAMVGDGHEGDTSDTRVMPPDALACFGPSGWSACFDAMPTHPVMIGSTIDTDPGSIDCSAAPASWTGSGQPDACFVVGGSITLPATTSISRVTGARPLVLVAADSITIETTLDVASQRGAETGPGANVACGAFAQAPTSAGNNKGGGGGAGGSFTTAGGDGGRGDNSSGSQGTAAPTIAPKKLRGGCPGQPGGDGGNLAGSHGVGADGGGSVYLLAGNTITIATGAIINASGAGSSAGSNYGGGGGGGTGGMIALYATTITSMGTVLANGGGGSSGGDEDGGGNPGANPSTSPTTAAAGGSDVAGNGGDGGGGFAQGTDQTNGIDGSSMDTGGGGGGGGAGYILTHGAIGGGVSPSPVTTL